MNIDNYAKQDSVKHIFANINNELVIGGLSLNHIEKLTGSTPFYAYDKQVILNKINKIKDTLPNKIKLHYAIKANPYPSLVHCIQTHVSGFDVASKKEMLLALQTGMPAKEISFAGPGKTDIDIQAAIVAGVTLHIESKNELEKTIQIAKILTKKADVALRINPIFELKSSGMKMSGGAKPFGIDEEQVPCVLSGLPSRHVNLRGFHIFAGSQNLNINAIMDCHQQTFALAERLIQQTTELTNAQIDYINIGGGFGIPYFKSENTLKLSPISNNLQTLLTQYHNTFTNIDIVLELGRYLVAESGVYVSKIVDKKISRGTTYLVCNGGLHHHLANSGNFGQVIRKNFPVAIGNKINSQEIELEQVTVVGSLCTPLDILAEKIRLPSAKIGDYFVVFQSGAYGASASPKDFLSHPPLAEIFL